MKVVQLSQGTREIGALRLDYPKSRLCRDGLGHRARTSQHEDRQPVTSRVRTPFAHSRDGQYVSYIRKLRKLQHKLRNFHVYDDPRFG